MATTVIDVWGAYGPRSKREAWLNLFAAMKSDRASFDSHWRDIADFIRPRRWRGYPGDRNKGDRRNQKIIDSTATFAWRTLQSGMHAGLTSPARPWFKLSTPDPDLAQHGPVQAWLYDVTERMRVVFAQTNLYQAFPTVYGDLGGFGTGAMAILDDRVDLFRATAYPIGSYVLGVDDRGVVNRFGREYELTVAQVVEQFGGGNGQPARRGQLIDWSTISTYVRTQWERANYEAPVQVIWTVGPNPEANAQSLYSRDLPFSSCHFELSADNNATAEPRILRESGFQVFPVLAPRWDVTGEDSYGTDCPGMMALGDVKQLQSEHKTKGRLLVKAVDPALKGPSALRTQQVSLASGEMTYTDERDGTKGLSPIHEVRLEGYQYILQDVQDVQYRIRRAFFEDLFLMLAQSDAQRGAQPLTAREIDERHEEKLLALGPVLERTNDEMLSPLIDIAYAKMERAGLIPPPPPELQGVKLAVEYTSILAQAQKLIAVVAQDRFTQTIVGLAQATPDVLAKVDTNRLVDDYAEILGVDPLLVKSDDAANATLQQQRQMAAAAQQAQVAKDSASAAKTASETPLSNGGTALDAILGGGTGAPLGGVPA